MYRNLKFFNKSGNLTNFSYDTTLNKWVGQIDMGLISVDLIASYQLFIMEDVEDVNDSIVKLTHPIKSGEDLDYVIKFKESVDDIFIYNFAYDVENSIDVLEKSYESYLGLIDADFNLNDNLKSTSDINLNSISINLALWPRTEDSFFNTLLIVDPNNSDHVLAEINLYGESEGEDERLTTMLTNLGLDLLPSDVNIFKESDVNEEQVDWILLNRKKKELLLEHSNIFPYMGSYKALINILKYFGYSNVRLKEYWQNIDDTTANFGKFKQIDIAQIFTNVADYIPKELINSKIWNKTNKFGLFYDITIEDSETDDRGTPYTKEVFTFTPDEILIKIFALKKKLQQKFLPINAKIVDIVGEAVLFGTYSVGHMPTQNVIQFIDEKLDIDLICLNNSGYIDDLRYLERTTEIDILNHTQLELSSNEINLVKENNWKKSDYFPNNLHVNIGFPLILNIDLNLTWDEAKESFDRIGGDTGVWNTLDLLGQSSLTNLTYEIESSSGVFKYVKDITLFNTNNLEIGIILPYKDTYSIKVICKTASNFEHIIYKKDFVTVNMFNADFIGFCSQGQNANVWDSKRTDVQTLTKNERNKELSFNEMNSIWDNVQQPNDDIETFQISYDNLDLIEFKQHENSNIDEYAKIEPLRWNKTKSIIWDESEHLWWDNIGTNLVQFDLFSILNLSQTNSIQINDSSELILSNLIGFNSKTVEQKHTALIRTVKDLNEAGNIFNHFIYYYLPHYELDDLNNSTLVYDIRAISKAFSLNRDYVITCNNTQKSIVAKESIDTGFIGDIPAHFDIYKSITDADVFLTINRISGNFNYVQDDYIQSGFIEDSGITSATIALSGSIQDYLSQLNSSTNEIISSFTYSLHQVKADINSTVISYKISAISKYLDSFVNFEIGLNDWSNVVVTTYARPIVKNPSYQNVKVIKYNRELPLLSRTFFTTDNCFIPGMYSFEWKMSNTSVLNFRDIYLKTNIVSYMFYVKGSYDIELKIVDKNGNENIVNKQEFIKIT